MWYKNNKMRFVILNGLGVDHECNGRTRPAFPSLLCVSISLLDVGHSLDEPPRCFLQLKHILRLSFYWPSLTFSSQSCTLSCMAV